jgi:hypothetical protein
MTLLPPPAAHHDGVGHEMSYNLRAVVFATDQDPALVGSVDVATLPF